MAMLYERWLQVANELRQEIALFDSSTGRRWTFGELLREAERQNPAPAPVVFPSRASIDFVLCTLTAWRSGQALCPLEPGQSPPNVQGLPAGCVHLKTTSASTGVPRLIAFTADQLAADAQQIVTTMHLRPEWPNLAVVSLAHSYGFSSLVLPLLLHGIPLILAEAPLPETLRRAAGLVSAITLPAVPALWRTWMEADAIPKNVRLAISAGAPLPLPLERAVFDRDGIKIHNFYGASECGGIAYDGTSEPRMDGTCVGAPMHDVHLSTSQDGCLCVRSAAAGLTYWPEPSSNLANGTYQTSDLARLTDGLVFLCGRQTDMINVAGRKVSPESIERQLLSHSAVSECLVFGAPSPEEDRAEIIVACVVTNRPVSSDALKQHLLARLPAWQIPRDWWFLRDLSVNVRGKLSRREWRERYLSGK